MKYWIVSISVIALLGYGAHAYLNSNQDTQTLPILTVETGTIEKNAVAVGSIVPAHSVSIKSQINGIVGELYVQVGDKVSEGQPLLKVRPNPTPQALTDASTTLMQAEAEMESARQKHANLKSLVEQKVIPSNYDEYVNAKSNLKSVEAKVLQARQNLALIRSGEASVGSSQLTSIIYSPIDGTVLNKKVEVGAPIISTEASQAATEMMSIADLQQMVFKGSVSEHDAAILLPGMPVTLTVAPFPDTAIKGVLSKVAIQSEKLNAHSESKSNGFDNGFEVEVGELTIPDTIKLRSGFSSTATITLKKAENVLVVPERALQFEGETPHVLIADASELGYRTQVVELGMSDGIVVEVLSGVSEADEIIDASIMGAPHGE
ncbi:membrane-fusion protein [Vibrio nigripulchritudo ATCC 27043]|uniref:efflux RND transporter periplasmic adaptor subunit n=1 Tax=Vibrio nigripulchritudo TaxID=28173 RepID=UPI00021C1B26|nr:efflux RND transporter periplasmic adaptor subunit [Vibrio nigripulchritudo]EGU61690.1 membrane-fusion protein [Vibrio nigripulchritudo ATCC 27043]